MPAAAAGVPRREPLSRRRFSKLRFHWQGGAGATGMHCRLRCMRCRGVTARGARCARFTCYALPYCVQHLRAAGLRVGPSTIPGAGRGLFVAGSRGFARGQRIVPYLGELKSAARLDAEYGVDGTAPYALTVRSGSGWVLDAACARGAASLANSVHGTSGEPNAEVRVRAGGGQCGDEAWLVATERIPPGNEVLIDYGSEYEL